MPLSKHAAGLNPNTLPTLKQAFDEACSELQKLNLKGMDEQQARDLIAKRIVAAAIQHGERDPANLCRYALEAFQTG